MACACSANAAAIERDATRREAEAEAAVSLTQARSYLAAWQQAADAARAAATAAGKVARGQALGEFGLDAVLVARQQASDARRAEIDARAQAAQALMQLRIDAHLIWSDRAG